MPALFALLSSLLWGTADYLGGVATRRLPGPSVVGGSQLIALLALLPIVALTGALDTPTSYVVPGVLGGLVGTAAIGAFYQALATGTMGIVAPVAALGVVLPVAAGLAHGDAPTVPQLLGIAVAVAGVVLASGPELTGGAGARPLLLAVAAAIGFGVVFVLIAQGSRGGVGAVVMTLVTMRLTSVLARGVLLMASVTRRRLDLGVPRGWDLGVRRGDLPLLVAVGLGDVGANACYAVATRAGLLSVVSVLGSLYPVVTVLLARRLLAERLRPVQIAGVGAALVGVVLLAAG